MKSLLVPAAAALVVLSPVADAHAQITSFITTNRTVAGGNPITEQLGSTGMVIGGDSVKADVVSPASLFYLVVGSNSDVTVRSGYVREIAAVDTSTVSVQGAAQVDRIGVSPLATVNVTGGTVGGSGGYGLGTSGTVRVSGGTVTYLNVGQSGRADITGGTLGTIGEAGLTVDSSGVSDDAYGLVRGGVVNGILLQRGLLEVAGGTINTGSRTSALRLPSTTFSAASQIARVRGGTFNGGVVSSSIGFVEISGGRFDSGIEGRTFATLGAGDITFLGQSLMLSAPTTATFLFENVLYQGNNYLLTGTLASGDTINRVLFDAVSVNGSTSNLGGGFSVLNVAASAPEPSALALLVLPAIGVVVRRKKF